MKYALITGGSSGIGKEIAVRVALDHGYHVLVNYVRNQTGADEVVSRIKAGGGSAESIQFNIIHKEEVDAALSLWTEKNGDATLEVIINNAGSIQDELMVFMEEEKWDQVLDVKLKGFYNVTRFALQKMLINRYGRIVNITSLMGLVGAAGQVNYSAANGGLIAASKALAKEVAKRNITVNAVAPGFIKTEMTQHLSEDELKKMIPAQRFGTAEEVADLVSFLVSKKASYINGEVITISGGL
jgi:3-oxoacyl-[acyl-carrier protein] reductase